MELWDVYDRDRNQTGKTMVRGSEFEEGAYHIVVHACIFNARGEMLIQQRQPFKSGWPNLWDITVGGSAVAGDTSQMAMERELFEEIGLKVSLAAVRPHLTVYFENGFDDVYLIQQDVDIAQLKLQYEEVQRVKWATLPEIIQMIEEGIFIPYQKSLIQFFFDSRNHYGCHSAG